VHPIHNQVLPHEGIDVSAPMGTPILAAAKGRVAFAGQRDGYGLVVEIDHGFGYVTLYGHASRALVTRGQQVARGDLIAQVGRSGIATSPHLHYEVRVNDRPVNPLSPARDDLHRTRRSTREAPSDPSSRTRVSPALGTQPCDVT
jgi:murein DD-endopeptidase MepM/ murein hydrolase activator NlpD